MSGICERLLQEHLRDVPLIAILRSGHGEHLDRVIETLAGSGVRALEVTGPTPGSAAAISEAARRHGRSISVGCGTVTTADQVTRAAEAGAGFVVAPNTDTSVIGAARRLGLAVLPGAFTPTEITAAATAGATAVKVFPARSLGPAYICDVLAPLPDLRLVPVGGVGLEDVPAYLDAGAVAVGVGRPLLGDALEGGDLDELAGRAAAYVAAARAAAPCPVP
ncbi:bifunctional 4-hydroxy-2-oxoglutarate aldolase/2-dehydro-3-deoxy-phosphogluconate aldolase [Actinoallomurus iriomotensis]|uniref:2-keto-3-deoxy-phosphogluconate aldolase n=1 Tax=Actinoallomurus iriomotensis TaxID=478107 RepID=A0A9W6S6F5_9ACTN|nr:bifunctional 4-hydroxy-2-oxoglutarate aldolase/2-dehydro-3-deoxy-phosphogluconate aldolase [Actinoallomurus iriomotensis]GLY87988.1 2-keto-3-deoxy-phosphogluconate aldolase [Actinoallomurus iriomotensis]